MRILFGLFAAALVVSLSVSQIMAVLVIILGLAHFIRHRSDRKLWLAVGAYILFFWLHDLFLNGWQGLVNAIENTWMILLFPAVVALAPRNGWPLVRKILIYGFSISAVATIIESFLLIEGRYGFHSAPYVAAMVLIPISFMVVFERWALPCWLAIVLALVVMNNRVLLVLWALASLIYSLRTGRARKPLVILVCVFLLILVTNPARWTKNLAIARYADKIIIMLEPQRWTKDFTSLHHRFAIWNQVIDEIKERPLLGHGFEQFKADPEKVAPKFRAYLENQQNAHNGYLIILHSAGLVGYSLLWIFYGGLLYYFLRRSKSDSLSFVVALQLIIFILASFTDKTFFMTLPSIELWFLAGWAYKLEN